MKTKIHFFFIIHFLFLKNFEFFKIVTQAELVNKKNRTWFWLLKAKNWFSFSFFKNTLVYQRNLNFKICVKSSLVYTPFPDIILRIPVFLSKISPKSDFIRNHSYFFYFWTWISLIFLEILAGIHESFGRKIWNFGGIHEVRK